MWVLSDSIATPLKHKNSLTHPHTHTLSLSCLCNSVNGEVFLESQGIDYSVWGFWQNHVALLGIILICMSLAYVQLLRINRWKWCPSICLCIHQPCTVSLCYLFNQPQMKHIPSFGEKREHNTGKVLFYMCVPDEISFLMQLFKLLFRPQLFIEHYTWNLSLSLSCT